MNQAYRSETKIKNKQIMIANRCRLYRKKCKKYMQYYKLFCIIILEFKYKTIVIFTTYQFIFSLFRNREKKKIFILHYEYFVTVPTTIRNLNRCALDLNFKFIYFYVKLKINVIFYQCKIMISCFKGRIALNELFLLYFSIFLFILG